LFDVTEIASDDVNAAVDDGGGKGGEVDKGWDGVFVHLGGDFVVLGWFFIVGDKGRDSEDKSYKKGTHRNTYDYNS
jgi:hypothetical protein